MHLIIFILVPCQTVYDSVCYAVIPLTMNWSDSRDNCIFLGGQFAEVTLAQVNNDLKAFVNGKCFLFVCVSN